MFSLDLLLLLKCKMTFQYMDNLIESSIAYGSQQLRRFNTLVNENKSGSGDRRAFLESLLFQLMRFRRILQKMKACQQRDNYQFDYMAMPKYSLVST